MEKKVCVTGGAGYIGSSLVKKLLEKGYIVHATLWNLDDPVKVGLLKNFPGGDTKLRLFKANLYNPDEFEQAIKGCEYVFHVATPLQHQTQDSQYKDTSEAAIAGVKSIARSCIKEGTVKRLIYTATVVSASPLKEDGTGYKDSMDESCWTPLNLSFAFSNNHLNAYANSKTLSEKEALSYNNKNNGELEVVALACGLVGGDTVQSYLSDSIAVLISQPKNNENVYPVLRFLEELLGKVPIVHIDDVCNAHVFCMEKPSINGRFLCASAYVTTMEIANYYRQYFPELPIAQEYVEKSDRKIEWGSTKLKDMGFVYKYDMKKILDDTIECARKMGAFK